MSDFGAFSALRIADSSLGAHQTWLDAISNNLANINTYEPTSQNAFQAQYPIFQSEADGGVAVSGIAQGDAQGIEVSLPDSPLADAKGYVRAPDESMSTQMGMLIMAQQGYQASVSVTKTAQTEYNAALQIGK